MENKRKEPEFFIPESIRVENERYRRHKRHLLLFSVGSVLIFLLIWGVLTRTEIIPSRYLNPPLKVFQTFVLKLVDKKPDGTTIPVHLWASFKLALVGFLAATLIGIPLGLFMGYFKHFDWIVNPIFEVVRPIPPIAWIPISILWLGIGYKAKGFIIFLAAFVPCVINAHLGVKLTKNAYINVARTFGGTRWQIFRTVCVPFALPLVFTSLRIALGNAWSCLVAAEMLAATAGLGFMIQQGRAFARPDIIIVGMATIGLTGALLSYCLALIERKITPWRKNQ